jgi:hypothetical protein
VVKNLALRRQIIVFQRQTQQRVVKLFGETLGYR